MNQTNLTTEVRKPKSNVGIIDINGDVTGFAENALMDAFAQASNGDTSTILLNFSNLDYIHMHIASTVKEKMVLEDSYHVISIDLEKDRIYKKIFNFITNHK